MNNVEDCRDQDPFVIGMKIHSLVDRYRNLYMDMHQVQERFANTPNKVRGVKIFEDMIAYQL